MKKFNVPGECPVCGGELKIEKVSCTSCDMQMTGNFYVSGFSKLTDKQLEFVKTFIKCKGSIKEMEKELGISYPTVKGRLDEVAAALGLDMAAEPEAGNTDVLESLEKGELSIEEAVELIRSKR
ncbi:MAG: DUF2089 domain-containing protein [Clostridia bacterium]